jgi:hypothetical protein
VLASTADEDAEAEALLLDSPIMGIVKKGSVQKKGDQF